MAVIPDNTLSGSPIGNLDVAVRAFATGPRQKRTIYILIAHSRGLFQDNGAARALYQCFSSYGYNALDFGVISPLQAVANDYGGNFFWRRLATSAAGTLGNGTLDSASIINVTGATYTHASKTITAPATIAISSIATGSTVVVTTAVPHNRVTGDSVTLAATNSTPNVNGARTITVLGPTSFSFTGVTVTVAGTSGTCAANFFDHFSLSSGNSFIRSPTGTGVTVTTDNIITAATSTTLVLTTSLGAGADGSTNIACLASRSPSFAYDAANWPTGEYAAWGPHGSSGLYYVAPATTNFVTVCAYYTSNKRQCPVAINGRLVRRQQNLRFSSGTGTFRVDAYYHTPPSTYGAQIGSSSLITTSTGTDGQVDWTTETAMKSYSERVTADSKEIAFGPGINNTNTGRLVLGYAHLTNFDLSAGYSIQTFAARGGMSRYRVARLLTQQLNDTAIELYLRSCIDQANSGTVGGDATCNVVFLLHAEAFNCFSSGNDVDGINKNSNSLGPSPAASNTTAGHTDNLKAIVTELTARLSAAATAEGITATPYFASIYDFCISDNPDTGSPPTDYATNAKVQRWHDLAFAADSDYANTTTNVCVISESKFATCGELAIGGVLAEDASSNRTPPCDTDTRHLSAAGEDLVKGRWFSAIQQAAGSAAALGLVSGTGVTTARHGKLLGIGGSL